MNPKARPLAMLNVSGKVIMVRNARICYENCPSGEIG
jgi:hypothetical protein